MAAFLGVMLVKLVGEALCRGGSYDVESDTNQERMILHSRTAGKR